MKPETYRRCFALIFLLVAVPILYIYVYQQNQNHTLQPPSSDLVTSTSTSGLSSCRSYTGRFIVVTTINYPTDSVKKLASLQDWCVIVVGDAKTPRDWKWTNCVFLSLEKQMELGYKTLNHVPRDHYGRKNIGYLYAIQHGAEAIYETDDDNLLTGSEIPLVHHGELYLSLIPDSDADLENSIVKREVCDHVVNIYAYFGQPTVWPRGIPLECLGTHVSPPVGIPHKFAAIATHHHSGFIEKEFQIGVDQGLANGDPDLDAIFRLTRIPSNQRIDMDFNPDSPMVGIPKGTFSPYNSQNTIYYRDAFWGLLLPISTSSRVCDIWRGYITQRLLWDVGLRLAFRTATVVQYRNPHSYMKDFVQERALYEDGGRLVDFLLHFDSNQAGDDIFSRMIALQMELVKGKFVEQEDTALLGAWVDDLKEIGYQPPRVIQNTNVEHSPNRSTLAWVLHFTYVPIQEVVDILLEYYAKHFALIVIVSPSGRPRGLRQVETPGTEVLWSPGCRSTERSEGQPGGAMVRCYVSGLRILSFHPTFQRIDYIVVSNDDVILNMTKVNEVAVERRPVSHGDIIRTDQNPPLFSPPSENVTYFGEWQHGEQWTLCQTLFSKVPQVLQENYRKRWGHLAMTGGADVFFLPSDSVHEFIKVGSLVGECWLEIALPNLLGMLTNPTRFSESKEKLFIYERSGGRPWAAGKFEKYFSTKSVLTIHPYKLSKPGNRAAFINFSRKYNIN